MQRRFKVVTNGFFVRARNWRGERQSTKIRRRRIRKKERRCCLLARSLVRLRTRSKRDQERKKKAHGHDIGNAACVHWPQRGASRPFLFIYFLRTFLRDSFFFTRRALNIHLFCSSLSLSFPASLFFFFPFSCSCTTLSFGLRPIIGMCLLLV